MSFACHVRLTQLTIRALFVIAVVLCLGNPSCWAGGTTVYTWNVDADGFWDLSSNWAPSSGPPNSFKDEALFGSSITAARVITLQSATFTVGNLSFNNSNQYTVTNVGGAFTSGNSLTLSQFKFTDTFDQLGSGSVIINVPLALGSTTTLWGGAGTGTVTVNGTISGSAGITKTAGTWILALNGVNTYTGPNTITLGGISVQGDSGLGAVPLSPTAASITLDGGTLITKASFTLNANRGITLGANGGSVDVASGTTLTYNGIVAGLNTSDAFVKTNSGSLILGGVNTYQGPTFVYGGVVSIAADSGLGTAPASPLATSLTLDGGTLATTATLTLNSNRGITLGSNGGTIDVAVGATLTYNGVIGGTNTLDSLTKTGAGALGLGGVNTFQGPTTITAGTLIMNTPTALGSGTGSLTINGSGATLQLGYSDNVNNALFNNITLQNGSITRTASANLKSGILDSSHTLTVNGTGTLLDQGNDGTSGYLSVDGAVVVQTGTLTLKALTANDEVRLNQKLTIMPGATVKVDGTGAGTTTFGSGSGIVIEGQGTASSQSTVDLSSGTSSFNAGTSILLNGAGTGGLKVSGTQANVDNFLTVGRISTNLSISGGGTLTLAYTDPNLTANFSKAPSAGTQARIGFYVPSGSTNTFGTVANDMQNWGGLVVDGPQNDATAIMALAVNENLKGDGTHATTLDLLGGDYQLAGGSPVGGKTNTISGTATFSGGIIDGGPGGGSRGLLVIGGDMVIGNTAFGTTGHGLISITMAPGHNTTNTIRPLNTGVNTAMNGSLNLLTISASDSTGAIKIDSHITSISVAELHVAAGTLLLGANNQFNSGAGLVMEGGTLNLNGNNQSFGTLTLTANSHLAFGGSANTFDFGIPTTMSALLTVDDWVTGDTLKSDTVLNSTQLGQIRFGTLLAQLDPSDTSGHTIMPVPVPEPGAVAGMILIMGLILFRERKWCGEWIVKGRFLVLFRQQACTIQSDFAHAHSSASKKSSRSSSV